MVTESTWSSFAAPWTDTTGEWDVDGNGTADGMEANPRVATCPRATGPLRLLRLHQSHLGPALVYQAPRSIRLGFTLSF